MEHTNIIGEDSENVLNYMDTTNMANGEHMTNIKNNIAYILWENQNTFYYIILTSFMYYLIFNILNFGYKFYHLNI